MKLYTLKLLRYLLQRNSSIANAMLTIINVLSFGRWKYKVVNCDWLDRYKAVDSGVLREVSDGVVFYPWFNGLNQPGHTSVHYPEVKFRLFENAGVSIISSSILMGDGSLAIERFGRDDSSAIDYSGGHILMHHGNRAIIRDRESTYLECGIFFGGNGAFNYYHWLMEIIAKSEFFHKFPYQNSPLLISSDVDEIHSFKEILEKFSKTFDVILLKKDETYRVGELVYIDAPNNLPFNLRPGEKLKASHTLIHPQSIDYIRRICLSQEIIDEGNDSSYPKKIFLKRKIERRRYNQESVECCLHKHGFVSVYMEELSFDEQVRTMFNADWIVGPTGAAWTNILFCRKNTNALCWMAEELGEFSAFSTIAANVGVQLRYLTYRCGNVSTEEAFTSDYHIDVGDIEAIVNENLGDKSFTKEGFYTSATKK